MSLERQTTSARFLGAELDSDAGSGRACPALVTKSEGACPETNTERHSCCQQFENPANPEIHRKTTAEEIWVDTDGKVDYFGVRRSAPAGRLPELPKSLKPRKKDFRCRLSGLSRKHSPDALQAVQPGPHKIQGIGAGFVPAVLNKNIIWMKL